MNPRLRRRPPSSTPGPPRVRKLLPLIVLALVTSGAWDASLQQGSLCQGAPRFRDCFTLVDSVVLEQPPEHLIAILSGAVLTQDGATVLADGSEGNLKVYDGAGRLKKVVGRKGRGPAEFLSLTRPVWGAGGKLYVIDPNLRRLTVFTPTLELERTVQIFSPGYYSGVTPLGARGEILLSGVTDEGAAVVVIDSSGREVETLLPTSRVMRPLTAENEHWRVITSIETGLIGRNVYVVSTVLDTVWQFNLSTKHVRAFPIPLSELHQDVPGPKTRTLAALQEWFVSFYYPRGVHVSAGRLLVPVVRGIVTQKAVTILGILNPDTGAWTFIRNAPAILASDDRRILALLNPNPDRLTIGVYRWR